MKNRAGCIISFFINCGKSLYIMLVTPGSLKLPVGPSPPLGWSRDRIFAYAILLNTLGLRDCRLGFLYTKINCDLTNKQPHLWDICFAMSVTICKYFIIICQSPEYEKKGHLFVHPSRSWFSAICLF